MHSLHVVSAATQAPQKPARVIDASNLHKVYDTGTDVKVHAVHPGTFKIYCQLHPTHSTATLVVQ